MRPAYRAHTLPDGRSTCTCSARACCPSPGKHPKHAWQREGARGRKLPSWLRTQWDADPLANVAVITGRRSGVVVADVDPRHGGTLDALWASGWPEETSIEQTGGGGWHVYAACPASGLASVDSYAPGIEVKADGKLVIAAPSVYWTGASYRWLPGRSPRDVAPAPLPDDMLARLAVRKRAAAGRARWLSPLGVDELAARLPRAARLVDEAVERARQRRDGGRHATLVWLANRLALLGLRGEPLARCLFAYQERVKGGWSA